MVLLTLVATAAMVIALCFLPMQTLNFHTIQGPLHLSLEDDSLACFFMVLISCIWAPVAIFAFPYLHHIEREQQFLGFYTMTLGFLLGLAMSNNFVTLYMFFEMMSLVTMPLVLHDRTFKARREGLKYLGYSVFGAGIALAGFFFLSYYMISPDFTAGGTLNLALAAEHRSLLLVVYVIMIIGFGAKAGMMPMQAWLPTAHPVAPAPASAVLSGVITKAGVLAIIRVTYFMFGADFLAGSWAQQALIVLTLCTVFIGSMLAFREKKLKKRLAYSTVSQVSYVLFGLMLLSPDGARGALLHIVFHALAKDTLFLAAGAIIMSTGYTQVDQLSGIGKRMPVTMACFTVASLSLIGIPPLSGFISKWNLATASLASSFPVLRFAGVAILILSALLTAGYLLPIVTKGFFPGDNCITECKEVGLQMTGPMIAFSLLSVFLGLIPGGLINWVENLITKIF